MSIAGNPLTTFAAKQQATLYRFEWDGGYANYTDWTSDITLGDYTWSSLPSISLSDVVNHGGVGDNPVRIVMDRTMEPASFLCSFEAARQVAVTVEEVWPAVPTSKRTIFAGLVSRAISKPRAGARLAALECTSPKSKIVGSLGFPVTRLCAWSLGDRGCGVDLASRRQNGTVTAVDGRWIEVAGLSTGYYSYWMRGYVDCQGVRIGIRTHYEGPQMELIQRPPDSWLAQSCVVTPGCDKTVQTCLIRYANIARFGGLGFKMPTRMPLVELPLYGASQT